MKKTFITLIGILLINGLLAQSNPNKYNKDIPNRKVYGFFLSNKFFKNRYGFGKFYMNNLKNTTLLTPFDNNECIYAGAVANGIYYACTYFNRPADQPLPGYFISYDIKTGKRKNIGKWTDDDNYFLKLQDMTFDYSTQTMYGLMFENGKSKIKKIDIKTGSMTEVCILERTAGTLAADKNGTLYAISVTSSLYKIDKTTGQMSLIVDTNLGGLLRNQTMEFDHTEEGVLYWAAVSSYLEGGHETNLIRFDLKNIGKQDSPIFKNIGIIGSQASMQAIYIPFAMGGEAAPMTPKNLSIEVVEGGQKKAILSWINPDSTFGGEKLSDISSITILRDDKEVAKIDNINIGQKMTWEDVKLSEDKEYKYAVYASNSAGDGQVAYISQFIGFDAPGEVQNLTLDITDECNSVKISWEKPSKGLNGGILSSDAITYKIVRSDNITICDNINSTNFTDNNIDELNRYSYFIFATNKYGTSKTKSNSIVAGKAILPPVLQDFTNTNVFWSQWSIIDNNKDDYSWLFNSGISASIFGSYELGAEYIINPTITPNYINKDADEWLISPPISFETNKNCKVTIKARSIKDEKILITQGKTNIVDKQQIVKEIIIPAGQETDNRIDPEDYTVEFPIEKGIHCIGINLVSPFPNNRYSCIQISAITIEQTENTSLEDSYIEKLSYIQEGQTLKIERDFISFCIYSKIGELIVKTTKQQIDISNLPEDIYIIVIDTKYGKKSYKFKKQR